MRRELLRLVLAVVVAFYVWLVFMARRYGAKTGELAYGDVHV